MAQFYGSVKGSRHSVSRLGTKNSGYKSYCAGWGGGIEVRLWHDPDGGKDHYTVCQVAHEGKGIEREIARGIVGEEFILIPFDKSWIFHRFYADGSEDGYKEAMGSR